jgi:hypothetical protein
LIWIPEQVRDCHFFDTARLLVLHFSSMFYFFPVLQSLSGSLSLTSRKSFNVVLAFLNCKHEDFLILMRVIGLSL